MNDLMPNEIVYIACVSANKPEVIRARYLRPAKPGFSKLSGKVWNLVVHNDKGTEITVPIKFVYKFREDALARAEEMVG